MRFSLRVENLAGGGGSMNNFQLLFATGLPTVMVLAGILVNRQDSISLRSEMQSMRLDLKQEIHSTRSDLSGRIEMLTGKVIELTDRVSHLEARIGK